MAETVISVMVQLLTSLPLEAIIKGVNELRNVERRVDNLTRKLRSIRAVLQDAENRRWTSDRESVKDWLEMLEDDSHEMTNVLDRWNTLILISQIKKDFNQRRKKRSKRKLRQRIRHLTITMESEAEFPKLELSNDNKKFLHTFLILRQGDININNAPFDISMLLCLKHLRSLNLSSCGLMKLPENIGDLIHLRYLEVGDNPLEKLPNSFCNLCNLQTLRMESHFLVPIELPEGIGKLVNLRSLYIRGENSRFEGLPKGITTLPSLRILDWFPHNTQDNNKYLSIRELTTTMMNCNNLKIYHLTLHLESHNKTFIDLTTLGNIYELEIYPISREEELVIGLLDQFNSIQPHPKLKVLRVGQFGRIQTFSPKWIKSLLSLRKLVFCGCSCLITLPSAVAKLPSLEALEFWGLRAKFIGPELLGLVLGDTDDDEVRVLYPKLKVLKFTSAENWCEWKTEPLMIKIMPVLESLYFWSCSSLGVLPGFLCNVKSLKFIHISNATKLEKHCRVRDENEWPKISHAKNILLNGVHVQKEGHYLLH
ncbi:hypothetical protein CsatA_011289 [Cannabis sativa]